MHSFNCDSLSVASPGSVRASLIEKLRQLADDLEDVDKCLAARPPRSALNTWTTAERGVPCLVGLPLGHPILSDGKLTYSSELFYLDPHRGVARTMSRWYRLGTRVDPEFWAERLCGRAYPTEDTL
ncbi:DUF6634 family protein [Rhizobium laguerreae]|uniref:DUF6634 family protein n=1 Tax=Rhizobium laguerreae TaxID=1076926 RepID=UPI00103FD63E|nr:DUF6634 family protein [Rhizobium laguerreae]TBY07317.1 hypothetical protein E0I94_20905 [Rhizobium laguerreae]